MSSRKNKSDLLVKTRFQNPIPPPAFPPQTLDIQTDLSRLSKQDFTSAYAASLPMPMMVDAEIGMPLNVNACQGIWWDELDPAFNPVKPVPVETLHPDDAELLDNPTILSGPGASGNAHQLSGQAGRSRIRPEETWLRGTTYMAKNDAPRAQMISSRAVNAEEIDVPDASMLAQLQMIERTFWQHDQINEENIKNIKHPLKKGVTAIDAFDLLPDEDVWAEHYNQLNFPERPFVKDGKRVTNEQLLASIFRPQERPLRGFQAYIPSEEELPQWRKVHQTPLPADDERDLTDVQWECAHMPFVQDYEIVEQQKASDGGKVVVLSFCDGQTLRQQDEVVGAESSSSDVLNGESKAGTIKAEKEDEDEDDDDIFGDKELEEEEEAEAQKAEQDEKTVREKAKDKGVYYINVFSRVDVKRLRSTATQSYKELEDNWDSVTVAFQNPTHSQKARRDEFSRVLLPEWVQEELYTETAEQDREGEAMGEDDRV